MKNNPPKLLIIDGSSMLSTSYYGNLPKSITFERDEEKKKLHYNEILHNSKGQYTNAIFTMLRSLIAIGKKVHPDYIVFAFDMSRNTFRRTELGAENYKANRKETPAPLKEQFVAMEDILQRIGCKVYMSENYEADDFAASLVSKFESPNLSTYVITKDHDYFQIVSEYTRLWRPVTADKLVELKESYGWYGDANSYDSLPQNMFEYTPDIVFEEEGVPPELITMFLSIKGDPGDGIEGCKGVAAPAVPLTNEYQTLDNLYEAIDECEGDAKKEKALAAFWKEHLGITRSPIKPLKENRETVYLSQVLATMRKDLEINESLDDFQFANIDFNELLKVLDEYEIHSIKKDVEKLIEQK